MSTLFISYSSKDSEVAIRMQDFFTDLFALRNEEVFLAEHAIRAGANGERCILDAINSSEFLIYLISENFLDSPYCMCELGAAWAKEKALYQFLMKPLDSRHSRYLSIPPSIRENNQYVIVRDGDREKIKRFIDFVVEDISKRTGRRPHALRNDKVLDICDYLCAPPITKKEINLGNACVFHHPGEAKSTLSQRVNNNILTMTADYSQLKPQFAGSAVRLFDDNWIGEYDQGFSLFLSISATAPLSKVILEVKDKFGTIPTATKELAVSNQKRTYQFLLKDLGSRKRFECMTELTFLIDPSDFDALAKVEISDIRLDV